jgi:subtilisin family serine protease
MAGERVQFASLALGEPVLSVQWVLATGDYVLRMHAYRMAASRCVLDATFHEPPAGGDPLLDQQWGLTMSRVPEAWAYATGRNVTIAFIDSGVDLDHPDLLGKLVLVEGAAFVGGSLQDSDGHGTHVAGIAAAARDNGVGIAGVAPDARIMPMRVLTVTGPEAFVQPGFFTQHPSDIASAIRLATDSGANVISMSLAASFAGGDTLPVVAPQVDAALEYAWSHGVVLVAAAGNGYVVPVCADIASHPRVLCVGAVDASGQRASYSDPDIGQDFVVAPGGEAGVGDCAAGVLSTMPHGNGTCPVQIDGAWYGRNAGTSMAAPFVAGVAALLVQLGLGNDQVVQRIKETADPRVGAEDALPDPNPLYGHGLVDAYCAVTAGAGTGCA